MTTKAWRLLGQEFERKSVQPQGWCLLGHEGWAPKGLCFAVYKLIEMGTVGIEEAAVMHHRLDAEVEGAEVEDGEAARGSTSGPHVCSPRNFWWPRTPAGNAQRAIFCYLMAEVGESDLSPDRESV
jgi:hypothetical protein